MAQTKKGPEFPGGEEMLRQFLKENVQYPYAIESRKTYNVKAEVLVAKDGTGIVVKYVIHKCVHCHIIGKIPYRA